MTTVQTVAEKNSRSASELARLARRSEEIAEPANRLYDVDAQLLANSPHEYFDRIGITVEILIVEMLDELRARHHAPGMMHKIGQQAVFVRGELDRIAVDRHAAGAGIETNRAAGELALGMTDRAAQQRADAGQ